MINKVEICGVNTASLPVLSREEKNELFQKIKKGDQELSLIHISEPTRQAEIASAVF